MSDSVMMSMRIPAYLYVKVDTAVQQHPTQWPSRTAFVLDAIQHYLLQVEDIEPDEGVLVRRVYVQALQQQSLESMVKYIALSRVPAAARVSEQAVKATVQEAVNAINAQPDEVERRMLAQAFCTALSKDLRKWCELCK